ncbi:queuosine precursor transporter [Lysinibacter sp. HNR]|uniref:queuosine precursor transporter n=1 Tax=Lysinibacter sp. HNR TaxID=3031408 RepID=UPI0024350C15|nr:queuosine precursor transporter [Lysinibacter sp. HNR]WGD37279.1 queuosine precursor transporter [Lysinibacter sp. HNR]
MDSLRRRNSVGADSTGHAGHADRAGHAGHADRTRTTPSQGDAVRDNPPRDAAPRFVTPPQSPYTGLMILFCVVLLISNVAAVKLIQSGPLVLDGGVFLFPLAYILGDVISEVYGWKAARRAVFWGFVCAVLAALTFLIVQIVPPAEGWENQEAYEAVIGFVPRIVLASLAAFVAGQLINARLLVWLKERMPRGRLWSRVLGSTVVGQLADTLVFCTVAFYGVITGAEFLNYVITGYLVKVAVEVVALPVTYRVVAIVRRREG